MTSNSDWHCDVRLPRANGFAHSLLVVYHQLRQTRLNASRHAIL
ncbi:hypothetical protein HDF13_003709 [Edaphobacter lichenicola]|uniref:Uncharacterized protein n=1 Tax=Tunturiibacter gelidiferens TaxID=3069689 RepID=A0ACC5P437_9BACT|nr:hypothetical protein [Edaphobacter lichenicola]